MNDMGYMGYIFLNAIFVRAKAKMDNGFSIQAQHIGLIALLILVKEEK